MGIQVRTIPKARTMALRRLLATALSFFGSLPVALAAPQCDTAVPGFHLPAFDGEIGTVIAGDLGDGQKLYFGGKFRAAGASFAPRVARFDGTHFEPLGAGLDGEVKQLCVFNSAAGTALYAAGSFTASGSVPMRGLARWNGTSWSSIGDVIGGEVHGLDVIDFGSGPRLCVSGDFASIGGLTGPDLALFDGSAWTTVPTQSSGAPGFRDAARMDDGSGFRVYFATTNSNILSFDGTGWRLDGSVFGNGSTRPSLTVFDDGHGPRLYVTGHGFVTALQGQQSNQGLARFDGSQWSTLPGWTGTHVRAHCLSAVSGVPALYVLEQNLGLGRWTGSQFQWLPHWPQAQFWSGLLAPVDAGPIAGLWGCSSYESGGGTFSTATQSSLARYDGSSWTPFVSPQPAALPRSIGLTLYALGVHDDGTGAALHAAGRTIGADGDLSSGIARWDGASWSMLPGRFTEVFRGVRSITSFDDGSGARLYVGGSFRIDAGPWVNGPWELVAAWDGISWSSVGTNTPQPTTAVVRDMLEFDDGNGRALFVAGSFLSLGNSGADYVARWNGTSWQPVPGIEGPVHDLQVHDDGSGPALYAGGQFLTVEGQSAPRIAKWNGSSWSSVGGGLTMEIEAMASFGGALIVGGFDPFTPGATNNLRRWDGASWSTLSNSPLGDIKALLVRDTVRGPELVATGTFSTLESGAAAPKLARFDGTLWSGLDVGVANIDGAGGTGFALATYDDGLSAHGTLYVAGNFQATGASPSRSIARFVDACECDATTYCTSGTTSSGCTPVIAGVGRASATGTSSFALQASQLEGGRSGHVFYGLNGAATMPWGQSSHFLCVRAPTQRTGTQATLGTPGQCDGAIALDWNAFLASHPSALGAPLQAGQHVWAQAFFRDPPGPKHTALTNAVHFVICP